MKKNICLSLLVVLVLAFAGCEAGLVSSDGNGSGSGSGDSGFSFSDLYSRIKTLEGLVSPVGSIAPFAGPKEKVPDGWLFCDGQAYGRAEYSKLFQVIGTAWGTPDGYRFNVPDLRGVFLRGADRGTGKDPDAGSRAAMMSGGNTGDTVGSYQADEFESHDHRVHGTNHKATPSGHTDYSENQYGLYFNYYTRTDITGGNETRPKNVYVNYIIKY
ncbi:MAG: tail fiber protein [bacterium]|nr:tail fiber protein [bacterium]